MAAGPFLNIKAPKDLLDRLDDYRFATRKPSRAAAAAAFFAVVRAILDLEANPRPLPGLGATTR